MTTDFLKEDLLRLGYFWMQEELSASDFSDLCHHIGKPIKSTIIKAASAGHRVIDSCESIPFHTEPRIARYIGWHCISEASTGGETLLIDGHEVLAGFEQDLVTELSKIKIYVPKELQTGPEPFETLLQEENGIYSIYFIPWLANPAACQGRALELWMHSIRTKKPISIRLLRGQALLVDNHRVLHGRTEFAAHTGREILRMYIADSKI